MIAACHILVLQRQFCFLCCKFAFGGSIAYAFRIVVVNFLPLLLYFCTLYTWIHARADVARAGERKQKFCVIRKWHVTHSSVSTHAFKHLPKYGHISACAEETRSWTFFLLTHRVKVAGILGCQAERIYLDTYTHSLKSAYKHTCINMAHFNLSACIDKVIRFLPSVFYV